MDNSIKKSLKAEAHHLKTTVIVGSKGITKELLAEITNTINFHELIKIQIQSDTKQDRLEIAKQICQATESEFVQLIGKQAVIFKQKDEDSKFSL
jgi:RNA-binding protein